jgi:tetratricopeptide (TPR) repeat protein
MERAAAVLALLLATTAVAGGVDAAWLDAESRIQYGYYTEDARALTNVTQSLADHASATPLHDYYVALAHYRLAQVVLARDRDNSKKSVDDCVVSIEKSIENNPDSADAFALESACLSLRANLARLPAPFASSKSSSTLKRALTLAPRNPRVLLIAGLAEYDAGDKTGALGSLQKAVDAFERERESVVKVPGWGAAEAYAFLARSELDTGDAIAARAALEHALLLVPDFAYAHRLMARITG